MDTYMIVKTPSGYVPMISRPLNLRGYEVICQTEQWGQAERIAQGLAAVDLAEAVALVEKINQRLAPFTSPELDKLAYRFGIKTGIWDRQASKGWTLFNPPEDLGHDILVYIKETGELAALSTRYTREKGYALLRSWDRVTARWLKLYSERD